MPLLLDFPWSLDALVAGDPAPSEVIRRFEDLWRTARDEPVPIFSFDEVAAFCSREDLPPASAQPIRRVLQLLIRSEDHACEARPVSAIDSRAPWRQALYDEVQQPDWRRPRIVTSRAQMWGAGRSTTVSADACSGRKSVDTYTATIVSLDDFLQCEEIAREDDPWDVRILHTAPDTRHMLCALPRPPGCALGTQKLAKNLDAARRRSDHRTGMLYYLPPSTWNPATVDRETWYDARAFPLEFSQDGHRPGFLDFRGWIWQWDRSEQHWDVQRGGSGNHLRVLPDGRLLPR